MRKRRICDVVVIAAATITAFIGVDRASAAGVVNISTCQTLSGFNTVYRVAKDLSTCGDCLVVAADKITIDLQGHAITSTCSGTCVGSPCAAACIGPSCVAAGSAITDGGSVQDLTVVKNGSVSGYEVGVALDSSTRVSVLGITATDNIFTGIAVGPRGLVKSSEVSGSANGILVRDRGQVQQCNAHDNIVGIVSFGDNCLITMNTANSNTATGIQAGPANNCTVSYNTASNNGGFGIVAIGSGHLVTQNVAMNNNALFPPPVDYAINCPSTVTNNTSTNGFPTSYFINGTTCHVANNN